MKNKKKIIVIACILFSVIILALASSYALFRMNITKNSNFKLAIGSLQLEIEDTETEDKFVLEKMVPTRDQKALEQEGYTFTITNAGTVDSYYTVYLDDIYLNEEKERLDNHYIKFNLSTSDNQGSVSLLEDYPTQDRVIATGFLEAGDSITYTLKMWLDYSAGNDEQDKYFATQIRIVGEQANSYTYTESILNGADPVLKDNLIPVTIDENNGTVKKADTTKEWYRYEQKKWANAVILKNEDITYANNQVIPEDNIESYFVWIPKYSYQLFDGESGPTEIQIQFGTENTTDSTDSCATPMQDNQGKAGEKGNCAVGKYMTHPAFISFNVNGFWVGKFETGYDSAQSAEEAQVDKIAVDKIIIKPNVYSWREIKLGNMFENSYKYQRNLESHMMKNTEWGAVVYLSHSKYGTCTDVNSNQNYLTGYDNINESVTGNRTGIYGMSGGAWDYVMGYTTGATTTGGYSEITSIHQDFFENSNWKKYYDVYSATEQTDYDNRILGDATEEVKNWYEDSSSFVISTSPWFLRGGYLNHSEADGIFAFGWCSGIAAPTLSYRIVLAPSN